MLGTPVSNASLSGRLCLNFSDINPKHTGCLPSPGFQRPEFRRVPQLQIQALMLQTEFYHMEFYFSLGHSQPGT